MDVAPQGNDKKTTFTVIVTGANSGLGFATCCRLIDEFHYTRPQSHTLHLLFSTRDTKKSDDTLRRLNAHLQRTLKRTDAKTPRLSLLLEPQIKLEGVLVDLTRLLTVKALAKQLLIRGQRIDAIICNAGISAFNHLDIWKLVKQLTTAFITALTYPDFQVCDIGALAKPQLSGHGSIHTFPEPRLGQVFTANVFGHYMLVHWLVPIMNPDTRVVWVSSIGGIPAMFDADDLQGLRAKMAYDSSKRVTDLLVLTSELPSTRRYVETFLPAAPMSKNLSNTDGPEYGREHPQRPRMYVTHPGVVQTSIADLPWWLFPFIRLSMYLARWLGSPWHPIETYKGAVSMVHTALGPASALPEHESREGKGKWGSATDAFGNERVARTEVEGWEYCGELGVKPSGSLASSRTGYTGTTKEMREDFEETGMRVWKEMEEMRQDWEKRLGRIEVDVADSVDL